MDVVWILVLLSLLLVVFSLLFFLYSMKQGDHEHADRLSLMPLEDDEGTPEAAPKRDKRPQRQADAMDSTTRDHPEESPADRT